MAESCGFFDSADNDLREYSANIFAEYFRRFFKNGITTEGLKIVEADGMNIIEQSGYAVIQGFFYKNDGDFALQLDSSDPNLPRIDRAVLHLDMVSRKINLIIKKGNTSSAPVVPTLERDNNIYELGLAQIRINAGVTSITAGNITDERLNTDVCGISSAVVHPSITISSNEPSNLIQGDAWIQTL
ncbi:hypothetical protein KYB31_03940 [Clostridium felsineum]|uniref:hypothetical protein n=1 Tax=Clostridium felsineum TaxID=36839 RepID=UPI00214D7D65|nr:hypothetical protein [Clostridium felsineum]MCR3758148.1 hypothetical protein [Clostridium felsineum]